MDEEQLRALVASVAPDVLERLEVMLTELGYAVEVASDTQVAAEKASKSHFNVLLVGFPCTGLPLTELLKSLRWSGSPCASSPMILLAHPESLDEAERLTNRAVSRILNPYATDARLRQALRECLIHPTRHVVRALIRLSVQGDARAASLGTGTGLESANLIAQTENLSNTGALIRTHRRFAIGTCFDFNLELPGMPKPIAGVLKLVRQATRSGRERVDGFAATFVTVEGDGTRRLEGFLRSKPKIGTG